MIGFVVVFMFWNFLLMILVCKVGVVLVVGCMVILKLVEEIFVMGLVFVYVLVDVGFLVGVFNVVFGVFEWVLEYFIYFFCIRKVIFMGLMMVGW